MGVCDLPFIVDNTKLRLEIKIKLNISTSSPLLTFKNKKFEAKLKLLKVQLERNNMVHFRTLERQKPSVAL